MEHYNTEKINSTCRTCGFSATYVERRGPHVGEYCAGCSRWLRWVWQNRPLTTMPFGSYKGEPIKNLPRDYRKWLLTQAKIGRSLRRALEILANQRGAAVARDA